MGTVVVPETTVEVVTVEQGVVVVPDTTVEVVAVGDGVAVIESTTTEVVTVPADVAVVEDTIVEVIAVADGGVPGGPAGGDLDGFYPNPTVDGIQGRPVLPTAPAPGDAYVWNGAAWVPVDVATQAEFDALTHEVDVEGLHSATEVHGSNPTPALVEMPHALIIARAIENVMPEPRFGLFPGSWTNSDAPRGITGARITGAADSAVGDEYIRIYVPYLAPATNYDGWYKNAALPVAGATDYRWSFYARGRPGGSGPNGVARFSLDPDVGATVVTTFTVVEGVWQRYTGAWASGGASSIDIGFIANVNPELEFEVVGFQLEVGTLVTPYCDGDLGHGHTWSGTAGESTSDRALAAFHALGPLDADASDLFIIHPSGIVEVSNVEAYLIRSGARTAYLQVDNSPLGQWVFDTVPQNQTIPFLMQGNVATSMFAQNSLFRIDNTNAGALATALWIRTGMTGSGANEFAVLIEAGNMVDSTILGILAPDPLDAFTGYFFRFASKAGTAMYAWARDVNQVGDPGFSFRQWTEQYGGGRYRNALTTTLAGTVSKGVDNLTVAGVGTAFLTDFRVGDLIRVRNAGDTDWQFTRMVANVASDVSLTMTGGISPAYAGRVVGRLEENQYEPYLQSWETAQAAHEGVSFEPERRLWFDRGTHWRIGGGGVWPSDNSYEGTITRTVRQTDPDQTIVTNTAVQTLLWFWIVPQRAMQYHDSYRLKSFGRILKNAAGDLTVTIQPTDLVGVPPVTIALVIPDGDLPNDANRYTFELDALIAADSSETAQKGWAKITVHDSAQDLVVSKQAVELAWAERFDIYGITAFALFATWSAADPALSYEQEYVSLEQL